MGCWRQNRARKGSLCQGEVAPRLIFGKQAGVLPSDMLAKFFLLRLLCASGRCTKGLRAIAAGIQRRGSWSCQICMTAKQQCSSLTLTFCFMLHALLTCSESVV